VVVKVLVVVVADVMVLLDVVVCVPEDTEVLVVNDEKVSVLDDDVADVEEDVDERDDVVVAERVLVLVVEVVDERVDVVVTERVVVLAVPVVELVRTHALHSTGQADLCASMAQARTEKNGHFSGSSGAPLHGWPKVPDVDDVNVAVVLLAVVSLV